MTSPMVLQQTEGAAGVRTYGHVFLISLTTTIYLPPSQKVDEDYLLPLAKLIANWEC